jgi:nickel/cobalt exporter
MMRQIALWLCVGMLGCVQAPAVAHPMGNFSINHYARWEAADHRLTLRYVLDMAEIPTVTAKADMDTHGNGAVTAAEKATYLTNKAAELAGHLLLTLDGAPAPIVPEGATLELRPGAAGLDTMRLAFHASVPLSRAAAQRGCAIAYRDDNYPQRTGWKEIVVRAEQGMTLVNSDAPAADLSRELNIYPSDPGIPTPQRTTAQFTVKGGDGAVSVANARPAHEAAAETGAAPDASGVNRSTPQDAFTQSVAQARLTPITITIALLLALLFGGLHALSPGHGKAMVAAYLVGSRGTARHAALLGGVVTLTHTIVVYAVGLLTLVASRTILPERLYPVISVLSGGLVFLLGLVLLVQRLHAFQAGRRQQVNGDRDGAEEDEWDRFATDEDETEFSVMPLSAHAQQQTEPAISTRALIALGISGGALPCPSALVVLLSAIALHRVAFGLVLIVAYSLGLALVLTIIGIAVVKARGLLSQLPSGGRLMTALPVFSAAAITLIGGYLLTTALMVR